MLICVVFKQKTAYEMRIRDWSSDVCSSDLTAIIGRNAAIFDFGKRRRKGRLAWLLWAIVHVYLLVGFEKRLLVSIQWLWRYFTYQRGARLKIGRASVRERVCQPV